MCVCAPSDVTVNILLFSCGRFVAFDCLVATNTAAGGGAFLNPQ